MRAVLGGGGVEAQSFTPATVSGTISVPFVMDSSAATMPPDAPAPMRASTELVAEFVSDPLGALSPSPSGDGVPWASMRIASNLQMRYRVLGNPFIRRLGITFGNFAMNTQGVADHVTLGWRGASPATLFGNPSAMNGSGNWAGPVTTTVYETGSNSLASPGMVFRVLTGPDISETSTTSDQESWGFRATSMNIWGNGTQGAATPEVLGLYDSAMVVLAGNQDVVRAVVANTGHPVTVALWAEPGAFNPSVTLYARCGSVPTSTMWDRKSSMVAPGTAIFQMNPCTTGSMHIAIVNNALSGGPRVVRLFVGSNMASREYNLRIGIDYYMNPTELELTRMRFQRAAWMFFGMTGGTQIIRSLRFYNNAYACDWAPSTACSGNACDACIFFDYEQDATAFCHETVGRLHLYQYNTEDTITHEMGHCFTRNGGIDGLRDEYENRCSTSRSSCAQTWMGLRGNNQLLLCTQQNHGRAGVDENQFRSEDRVNTACSPAQQWGYFGVPPGSSLSQDSGWTWLNGRIPAPYPSDRTPEVLWMERFWSRTLIGRIDQME